MSGGPATLSRPEPASHGWPGWFRESQTAALADFEQTPPPSRKDEAWRYADLKRFDLEGFGRALPVTDPGAVLDASRGLHETPCGMVFANGRLLRREAAGLPAGVILKPLEQAASEHEGLFREFFMAQPVELGSHRFAALHRARVESGALLYVPEGVELAVPIELFHWVAGDGASVFPHTLVILGKNARATVIDRFGSVDGGRAFACGVNDLHLAPGSKLTYIAIQDWSAETLAFHLNSTTVARDAESTALLANFGGGTVRGESYNRLMGPGARGEMLSLAPLDGTRHLDQRTLQDHAAPHASSDLLYLNTLDDSSKSVFSGLIRVQEGAHRTDAYQKVRNILLSDAAEANSMPGLEILADDVRCTHGATSGEINEDELFYLEARGIPRRLGRRLIVKGFFQTAIDRLSDPELRAHLTALLAAKLGVPE